MAGSSWLGFHPPCVREDPSRAPHPGPPGQGRAQREAGGRSLAAADGDAAAISCLSCSPHSLHVHPVLVHPQLMSADPRATYRIRRKPPSRTISARPGPFSPPRTPPSPRIPAVWRRCCAPSSRGASKRMSPPLASGEPSGAGRNRFDGNSDSGDHSTEIRRDAGGCLRCISFPNCRAGRNCLSDVGGLQRTSASGRERSIGLG